jgi:ectoine hydroxylase-related dioxygenase (phytanoyl-CoA dioxygenase family)
MKSTSASPVKATFILCIMAMWASLKTLVAGVSDDDGIMFLLLLHLDDCGVENGPLKVIPGSHLLGRLPVREVLDLGSRSPARICTAAAGDVLAMKALTVHASEPAVAPAHRRVLHLDFTTANLPPPLEWAISTDPLA